MTAAQIASAARRQTTVIPRRSAADTWSGRIFQALMFGAVGLAFLGLGAIIWDFANDGVGVLSWNFVTSFPSRVIPERAGIESAILGTVYLMVICAFLVIPLGVMTAVYLALLRATAAGLVTLARRISHHPTPWVDDGLCACLECRAPWLVGDSEPSPAPVPTELQEMWSR